jgi:hypothetical protein
VFNSFENSRQLIEFDELQSDYIQLLSINCQTSNVIILITKKYFANLSHGFVLFLSSMDLDDFQLNSLEVVHLLFNYLLKQ